MVPAWARPPRTTDRHLDPEHYADYAAFVVAFAKRYSPLGVRHLIIWNEPNLRFEWGDRPPDPGAYAALLKVVYLAVKAVAPDAIVMAGALSPGASLDDGQTRMSDMQYLALLYDAQAGPYFDMLAVHAYGGREGPEAAPAPAKVNFRRIELVRQLMEGLGDREKRIIISEGGYNDHPRWSAAVRPAERIGWTIATLRAGASLPLARGRGPLAIFGALLHPLIPRCLELRRPRRHTPGHLPGCTRLCPPEMSAMQWYNQRQKLRQPEGGVGCADTSCSACLSF